MYLSARAQVASLLTLSALLSGTAAASFDTRATVCNGQAEVRLSQLKELSTYINLNYFPSIPPSFVTAAMATSLSSVRYQSQRARALHPTTLLCSLGLLLSPLSGAHDSYAVGSTNCSSLSSFIFHPSCWLTLSELCSGRQPRLRWYVFLTYMFSPTRHLHYP